MSVNGVTSATAAYTNTSVAQAAPKKAEQASTEKNTAKDTGVVYEKSANATDSKSNKITDYSSVVPPLRACAIETKRSLVCSTPQ